MNPAKNVPCANQGCRTARDRGEKGIRTMSRSGENLVNGNMIIFRANIFRTYSEIRQGCVRLHSGEATFLLPSPSMIRKEKAKVSLIRPTCENRLRGDFRWSIQDTSIEEIRFPHEGDFPAWTASHVCGASEMTRHLLASSPMTETPSATTHHHTPCLQNRDAPTWPQPTQADSKLQLRFFFTGLSSESSTRARRRHCQTYYHARTLGLVF